MIYQFCAAIRISLTLSLILALTFSPIFVTLLVKFPILKKASSEKCHKASGWRAGGIMLQSDLKLYM